MLNLKAARELSDAITNGFDKCGMRAAEALIKSIEEEYGPLAPLNDKDVEACEIEDEGFYS